MARLHADHRRGSERRPPVDEPQLSGTPTYVIDLDSGASAGAPGADDALDQFVSEYAQTAPILTPSAGDDWAPPRSPRHRPRASRWFDRKTVLTVVITMVATALAVAVVLLLSGRSQTPVPLDASTPDAVELSSAPAPAETHLSTERRDSESSDTEASGQTSAVRPPLDTDGPRQARQAIREPLAREPGTDTRQPTQRVERSGEPEPSGVTTPARIIGSSGTTPTATRTTAAPVPSLVPGLATSPSVVPAVPDKAGASAVVSAGSAAAPPMLESGGGSNAPTDADGALAAAPAGSAVAPARIQDVLNQYQEAISALDAGAARAVWPSVNLDALERAFEGSQTQRIELQGCRITVDGARASATCDGTLTYVPRVGRKSERVERRQFDFTLRRVDDVWSIDQVELR